MKILLLNAFSAVRGGAERVVLDTALELDERGHQVVAVFAFDDRRSPHVGLWPSGVNRYYVPELVPNQCDAVSFAKSTSGPEFEAGMRYLQDIFAIEAPDVLHVHNLPAVDLLGRVAVRPPMVRTVHSWDTVCESGTLRIGGNEACTEPRGETCRARCGYTDRFQFERKSAQNAFLHEAFEKLLPVSGYVRDVMVRNAFDPSLLDVVGNFTRLFADAPGVDYGNKGPVLAVGRMTPEKGFGELIEALSFSRTRPSLRIAGGDGASAYRDQVLTAAGHAGVEVEVVDWCHGAKLENAYRHASIVAVPSMWPEPFGLVGIEAMMAGKPVVAFDSGGISEWLEHGVTGFLVPSGDTRAFGAAIDRLSADRELRARFGRHARRRALERFSAERRVPRLLKIYEEAIHASNADRPCGRATLRDTQRGVGLPV